MSVVERSKGKIRFAFKDPLKELVKKPNKKSLIMLHFSHGKMRFKYSTGYYSCYNDWSYSEQRLKKKASILNWRPVNNFLDTLHTELNKEITSLETKLLTVEKEYLKSKLDELTNKSLPPNEDSKTLNVYDYFDEFLSLRKSKLKKITIRSYKQTKKLLQQYRNTLTFEDIDLKFYYGFIEFLEEDDKSLNTIGKHIKNLRAILRSATQEGLNTNMIFTSREFKVLKEQTTAIYLNKEEVNKMASYNLKAFPNLELARDIFIIGCYTGQRVSDYNGLSVDNIVEEKGVKFFRIKQVKTGKEVLCPITAEIRDIMNKPRYNNAPPPKLNEQDINNYIKIVGQKVGINQDIIRTFTRGGEIVKKKEPKYNLITTHTARRSFCTNMYIEGMSTYEIMYFSGHSSDRDLYNYIRIEKEQKAIKIAQSGFFNL